MTDITNKDYAKFALQVITQASAKFGMALVGLPVVAVGLLFTEYPGNHPFYKHVVYTHSAHYLTLGGSGFWIYEKLPNWGIMKPFDNLNYGLRGEPSGKWSAKRKGKEGSFLSKWRQAAVRNPCNGFRYMDAFSAQADNLDIVYKGDYGPLDIQPVLVPGWNFVKGTDRDNGKTYYSFQYVCAVGKTRGFRIRLGFKIEPSNTEKGDLPPQKERVTFTTRFGLKKINPF